MTRKGSLGGVAERLRVSLPDWLEEHRVPGVAVGVLCGEEQAFACTGVTSVWNPLAVDESTFFQIGSVGKVYTATALMALVDSGAVELDAPVRRYVPELRLKDAGVAERVTVLQLLNHTAGWDGDFFPDTGEGDDALARFVERLDEIEQVLPLGRLASYNNTAFNLAGRVIEWVTDEPFPVALRRLVFEPLGLDEHFVGLHEVVLHRFAAPHIVEEDGYGRGMLHEPRCLQPSGAVLSTTVRDFLRFAQFHVEGGIDGAAPVTRESLALMRIPTVEGGGLSAEHVGIAWMLEDLDGVQVASHGGSTYGQHARLLIAPAQGVGLVVLSNSAAGDVVIDEVERLVLHELLGVVRREPEPLALSGEQLNAYAGTYRALGQQLTLEVAGSALAGTVRLDPEAWRDFFPEGFEIPEQIDMPLAVVGADQLTIVDGLYKGGAGRLVRDDAGAVEGILLGGRFLKREAATSLT